LPHGQFAAVSWSSPQKGQFQTVRTAKGKSVFAIIKVFALFSFVFPSCFLHSLFRSTKRTSRTRWMHRRKSRWRSVQVSLSIEEVFEAAGTRRTVRWVPQLPGRRAWGKGTVRHKRNCMSSKKVWSNRVIFILPMLPRRMRKTKGIPDISPIQPEIRTWYAFEDSSSLGRKDLRTCCKKQSPPSSTRLRRISGPILRD
jgi:hypothetical protein